MMDIIKTILYQPLYNLLIFLAWVLPGHSLGWAIIALTIIVRVLLLPSSIKAAKAQARIQLLQPKIMEIRKKYKDHTEQSRALFDLYRQEGVSQFGSCLPLLIQFPILIVLYQVFRVSLDTSQYSLLYPFTPHPAAINTTFSGIDLAVPDPWVLPIAAGLSQFLLSRLMTPKPIASTDGKEDPSMLMMRQMNYIFPLVTVFIGRTFPAALALYWVASTLFGVIQQIYVNKNIKDQNTPSFSSPKIVGDGGGMKGEGLVKEEPSISRADKPKKDLMSKMVQRRLAKQEKKSGVSVTVRSKKR
ncbi:MAG: YidC/Oxa1 family membrane protein insertase [Patescibacteria group bacterium]